MIPDNKNLRLVLRCSCGASLEITNPDDQAQDELGDKFFQDHAPHAEASGLVEIAIGGFAALPQPDKEASHG